MEILRRRTLGGCYRRAVQPSRHKFARTPQKQKGQRCWQCPRLHSEDQYTQSEGQEWHPVQIGIERSGAPLTHLCFCRGFPLQEPSMSYETAHQGANDRIQRQQRLVSKERQGEEETHAGGVKCG